MLSKLTQLFYVWSVLKCLSGFEETFLLQFWANLQKFSTRRFPENIFQICFIRIFVFLRSVLILFYFLLNYQSHSVSKSVCFKSCSKNTSLVIIFSCYLQKYFTDTTIFDKVSSAVSQSLQDFTSATINSATSEHHWNFLLFSKK